MHAVAEHDIGQVECFEEATFLVPEYHHFLIVVAGAEVSEQVFGVSISVNKILITELFVSNKNLLSCVQLSTIGYLQLPLVYVDAFGHV